MRRNSAPAPCYSARLLWPFVNLLRERGVLLPIAADRLAAIDPDMRVPIAVADQLLVSAIELSREPDLGLLAGASMTLGDCPALDYAMSTAANVREAVDTAMRHARLANDALTLALELADERAFLRVGSLLPLHRASADFMMAGLFSSHVQRWPLAEGELQCLFAHPRPEDVSAYERAFGGNTLLFGAPHYGFAFAASSLDVPMPGRDPRLHELTTRYASLALAELPTLEASLSAQVRALLPSELAQGRGEAVATARKLRMSLRTLGRRLEEEGTSYKELLETVRHELSLRHLARQDISIAEVACLLGFADVTTFHRAFKRWTGQTPGAYRASLPARLT